MPSQIDLINRTLSELGKTTVSSVNETAASTYIANKLAELFPEVLLDCNWNWAVVYVEDNTPLVNNYSPDFSYTYQLPPDFAKFYRWATSGSQWPYYQFADGLLLANTKPVQYWYISNSASYEQLTPLVARALVYYTAAKSAPFLTNNVQLIKYLNDNYEMMRAKAILENDMERSVMSTPYNDFDRLQYV